MPTGDLFKFFLKANDTDYYTVRGGVVSTTTQETALEFAPDGWEETELKWGRSESYIGLIRSFSAPYEFVKDGARILRHVYYTQGIEGACKLVIKRIMTANLEYRNYYSGDIDFSQFVDKRKSVTAVLMEAGLAAILKANENTPYEIPIGADALSVYMDGIRLRNTSTVTLANAPLASTTAHQLMPVINDYFDESDLQVDVIEQPIIQALGTSSLITGHPCFKATIDGNVIIKYNINVQVGNASGSNLLSKEYRAVIARYNATTATSTIFNLLIVSNSLNIVGNHSAAGTVTIPMQPGETLSYFAGVYPFNLSAGTDAFMVEQFYSFSTLEFKYDLRLPSGIDRGYRFIDLFKKMSNKIAGNTSGDIGVSSYLSNPYNSAFDSKPYNAIVTCGDALRGLNVDSVGNPSLPAIKTTFLDLVKTAQNIWDLGLGIENDKLVMEPASYFFQEYEIANLGDISADEIEIHVATDKLGNVIKVGYEAQEYDSLNGKDEPNNTSAYNLPITRKSGTFDWVVPYRADMTGAEILRANLSNKTTTDSSNDNDTYLLDISEAVNPSNGAFLLNRPQNLPGNSISGVISGNTSYNIPFSPARNLRRNGGRAHMAAHLRDGGKITFLTSDKNKTLVSNLGSGTIAESADVNVSDLLPPTVLPILIKFQKSMFGLNELMMNYPKGYFGFNITNGGVRHPFKAYIDDVGVRPAKLDVYQFSLFLHRDTDLDLLQTILEL